MNSIVYIIISAVILILSFAPFNFGFLGFVALIPLFKVLFDCSLKKSFAYGFLFGFIFFLGTVYFVVNSMHNYGGMDIYSSTLAMVLMAAYLALYPALFSLVYSYFYLDEAPLIKSSFIVAALWVAVELLRTWVFTGFPWLMIGYSLAPYKVLIQASDIGGVWLISFVVVFVNYALYRFIFVDSSKDAVTVSSLTAILPIVLLYLYGSHVINNFEEIKSNGTGKLKAVVVQGNIEQSMKWQAGYKDDSVKKYRDLTMQIIKEKGPVDLILWPETAMPLYLKDDSSLTAYAKGTAVEANSDLLTGAPHYEVTADGTVDYYNSAFLIGIDGEIKSRYDKNHLVPFGEYIPLRFIFTKLNKIVEGMGDFTAGDSFEPLHHNKVPVGVAICFEAIFPNHSRKFVNNGALVLANMTNDGWFGKSSAPYQHLDMSMFRAVENKRPMLRAANTGISAIIDPLGNIVAKSGLYVDDALYGEVYLYDKKTIYTLVGDIVPYLSMVFTFGYFIYTIILRRRKSGEFIYD